MPENEKVNTVPNNSCIILQKILSLEQSTHPLCRSLHARVTFVKILHLYSGLGESDDVYDYCTGIIKYSEEKWNPHVTDICHTQPNATACGFTAARYSLRCCLSASPTVQKSSGYHNIRPTTDRRTNYPALLKVDSGSAPAEILSGFRILVDFLEFL